MVISNAGGRGRGGRGKRKFAPQGSWRQYSEGSYDDGAEVFAMLERTQTVPFTSTSTPPSSVPSGKGKKQAKTLVEKAWEIWGSDSTFNAEVVEGIFQNIKKSK